MSADISGVLVPHAPVLLPEVAGHVVAAATEEIRRAVGELSFDKADLVVLLSPHAKEACVYESPGGNLNDFGVAGIEVERPSDPDAVRLIASAWNKPLRRASVDHGVLVPLALLATGNRPVVAAGLRDAQDGDFSIEEAVAEGRGFAGALGSVAAEKSVTFLVSAHTSSALTPRAPLTERAEAKPLETEVLRALGSDPGALEDRVQELWAAGGSCSPGALAAYGAAFRGRASEVLAYQHPFGVGYVVARAF